MSDDTIDSNDGDASIERRSVLKSVAVGAATLSGIAGVGAAGSGGPDIEGVVRTNGDLSPAEAIEKLRRADGFDLEASPEDCYTETRCTAGCSGAGTLEERTCCPNIVGCGECCGSWNETGICC